jgi:hypothetical protein
LAIDVDEHPVSGDEILKRTDKVSIGVYCAILSPEHILLEVTAESGVRVDNMGERS